jgi:hypothetical protein
VWISSGARAGRFTATAWTDIAARFDDLTGRYPEFRYLADIVVSVLAWQGADRLTASISTYDLVVTARPVPEQPFEVVVVRSPLSGHVGPGAVLIEHRSPAGHDEWIVRPSAEAVALFWRFMTEKFGVSPIRPQTARK